MFFSTATNSYRAVNCDTNSYGAANITFGLVSSPCRACPAGMVASTSLPGSAAFWASDGAGKQGFTSPMACLTRPGFGYNGRVAAKCPVGSYNTGGNQLPCTRCAEGLSTPDNATAQVSEANCTLAAGFGFHHGAILPCPVGESNSQCLPMDLPASSIQQRPAWARAHLMSAPVEPGMSLSMYCNHNSSLDSRRQAKPFQECSAASCALFVPCVPHHICLLQARTTASCVLEPPAHAPHAPKSAQPPSPAAAA
jgi:hypothetical protein